MASHARPYQELESRLSRERGGRFRVGGPPVAMLYPSPYRVGMSSLGYQWILGLLLDAGFSAERCFLPDDVAAWRKSRTPLATMETHTPLARFPVIGVSLAYELELAGLVEALQLAGIPPLRRDRGPNHPRIVLGGPLTFSNPLPAAPFVDAMRLGEAEETVVSAIGAALDEDRQTWLDGIEALPGGFVPERHGSRLPGVAAGDAPAARQKSYPDTGGRALRHVPHRGRARLPPGLLLLRDAAQHQRRHEAGHARGHPGLCPRQRPSGGLVGAAISDHPRSWAAGGARRAVAKVGISSLRADRVALKPDIPRLLREAGYKTLTVASDAASQRLRRSMSKGTTEAQLLACAEAAREHGYKVLKVYMMVGVPDETDEDIDELIAFTRKLAAIHPVALGVAPFVPKRNTPMDTATFAGIRLVESRLDRLSAGIRGKAELRPTSARWAWVEAELAQGGPEAGLAVLAAVQAGGRFADWRRAWRR
ncbi:MAG: radical SAM protein [Thermomonas sp.]|nr:radical SAM protein [Thermomonas sp.]